MIKKCAIACISVFFLQSCTNSNGNDHTQNAQSDGASTLVEQAPSMEAPSVSSNEGGPTSLFNGYVLVKKTWRSSDDTLTFVDFWEHDPVSRTISFSTAVNRPEAVRGTRVYSRIRYDEQGYPVERVVFDSDGEPDAVYLSEFSDDGRLLQTTGTTSSLPGETLLSEFSYDTANRPLQVAFRLARNETEATTGTYSYSEQGLLSRFVSDTGSNVFTYEFTYDSDGLPVSKISSSSTGYFISSDSLHFDADGNLFLREHFDEAGALTGTSEYEYQRVDNSVFNASILDLIYAPNKY